MNRISTSSWNSSKERGVISCRVGNGILTSFSHFCRESPDSSLPLLGLQRGFEIVRQGGVQLGRLFEDRARGRGALALGVGFGLPRKDSKTAHAVHEFRGGEVYARH